MLNDASEKVLAVAKDYVFVRCELRDLLLAGCDDGLCGVDVIKNSTQIDQCKYAFKVHEDSRLYHDVKVSLRQLGKLYEFLVEQGLDNRSDQGLWKPAVADADQGDTQLNIMVSENWSTMQCTASQIHDDIAGANADDVRQQLDTQAQIYKHFKVCRRSGQAFKVAIRSEDGSRRTRGLNNYCLAVGEKIRMVPRDIRYRRKRKDAWRGVEEPLFSFVGKRGQTWMVYPDLALC